MRHAVIVTAAGSSCRFNENSEKSQKKEFIELNGKTILYWAVKPFTEVEGLRAVVITYQKGTLQETLEAIGELRNETGVPFILVEGGNTRQESVFNALRKLYENNGSLNIDYVSIHDGARPFVKKYLVEYNLDSAVKNGASAPALSVSDTLVRSDENGFVCETLDRSLVYRIQTPQTFKFPEIYEAHYAASNTGKKYTDDTAIYRDFGKAVALVEGDPENIKITYRKDLC